MDSDDKIRRLKAEMISYGIEISFIKSIKNEFHLYYYCDYNKHLKRVWGKYAACKNDYSQAINNLKKGMINV